MQHSEKTALAPPLDSLSIAFTIESYNAQSTKIAKSSQILKISQQTISTMGTKSYCDLKNRSPSYADREVIAHSDGTTILEKARPHMLMTSKCKGQIKIVGRETCPGASGETAIYYRPDMARRPWPI